MIENYTTWLGIGTGALLVLASLVWSKRVNKSKEALKPSENINPGINAAINNTSKQEQIRQIALIEKDEFIRFYQPVIDCVQRYELIVSGGEVASIYFDTVYKALRKRRSAIFEYGSSENDNKKRALWSFALFSALSIRHIVCRLSEYDFENEGAGINPVLIGEGVLARCNSSRNSQPKCYAADLTNVHLIDKVLAAGVIERLNQAGIYTFIVNSVTGLYQERMNPFYSIIEEVESHVGNIRIDEATVFKQNLQRVLETIQRNTFSKNQIDSLIFEGPSYLLIDRNFLWELFRMYAVSISAPLGKKEFEAQLTSVLNLSEKKGKLTKYTVSIENTKVDNCKDKVGVTLFNMIALPYRKVPYYQHSDRRQIQKQALERDVVISDEDRGLAEESDVASLKSKTVPRTDAGFRNDATASVGVKDLFSDQQ